jgi:large subunit ribosomal protein L22
MIYNAKHRYADVSARKMRPFAQLIRGRIAEEALELLRFVPNRGARLIEAVLKSALGNAEHRGARDIEELTVAEARIDDGPILKRMMPRARGSWYPIKKRYAHIVITLVDEEALAQHQLQEAQNALLAQQQAAQLAAQQAAAQQAALGQQPGATPAPTTTPAPGTPGV